MRYVSKSERKTASEMTWTEIVKHVRDATACDDSAARRQIGEAIEDGRLTAQWSDARVNRNLSPLSPIPDVPPRNADYWQECEIDGGDPDRVLEPPPYDAAMVTKRHAKRLDKARRFRKPVFQRNVVLQLWPIATGGKRIGAVSRKRGAKSFQGDRVRDEMRNDLRKCHLTAQQLYDMKEVELEARYGASRDTCRNARNAVLAESGFVDNSAK